MIEKRIGVEFDSAGVYVLSPSQFHTDAPPERKTWISRSIGFYTLLTLFLSALLSATREQRLLRGLKYQTRLCPGPPVAEGELWNWWEHAEELRRDLFRSLGVDFARPGEDRTVYTTQEPAEKQSAWYSRYPPVANDIKWPHLDIPNMRFCPPVYPFHIDGETFLSITSDPYTIAQESPSVDANTPSPTSDLETFEPYGRSEFNGILSGVLELLRSSRRALRTPEHGEPVVVQESPIIRICCVCLKKADFQIGTHIPIFSFPRYYCTEHLPKWGELEVSEISFTDLR